MAKYGDHVVTYIHKITSIVRCQSAEALRKATEFAERLVGLDTEITRTFITSPGGIERREVRFYRLGDYFNRIELIPCKPGDPSFFTLTFHIREGVPSSWKDLVIAVLRKISDEVPGVKTSILPGRETT